jgi:crossover junction endodeoxyribonuclease RusA
MSVSSWSFDLPFVSPPQGLSANDRGHWGHKASNTAMVRQMVFVKVRAAHVPALECCRVDVEWVVVTKHRRDTDNLAPLLKAIFDGIGSDQGVSARIVEDDDPAHMVKHFATIRYAPDETPRFIVTITDLGSVL